MIGGMLPSVAYRIAEKSDAGSINKTRSSAQMQRTIDDVKARIGRVETVADVFKDRKLLQFLLDATGNPREMESLGIVRKALTTPANDDNIAKKLNKPQLFAAVSFLGLNEGVSNLKKADTINEMIDSFVATSHEKALTQGISEVSRARFFAKNIAANADDPFKILGNGILRQVISKTLQLPEQIAIQPVETQARAITSRVDLTKFKDPAFTAKFIERYLTIVDQEASANGASGPGASVLSLFNSNGRTEVSDLLSNINALRVNVVV